MDVSGESKHVVILLDRSWEPALRPCVDTVQDILLNIIRRQDHVGIATTGGEWLAHLEPKAGRQTKLTKIIQAACELSPGIALDQSILLCLEALDAAARNEEASQWLLVFSDAYGVDVNSPEAVAAHEALSGSAVNIVFVNTRHFYGFYPDNDPRWQPLQLDIDALVEAASGRVHEVQLQMDPVGNASEQVMQFLTRVIPYAAIHEPSEDDRHHHEHAMVLRELRNAMEMHRHDNGNSQATTMEIFDELDTDGSGRLDARELKTAMRKIGIRLTATQVEHLAAALDHNGDGIDQDELMEFLHGPDSRAEQIAKARKQEEHRKRVEETRKRQIWEDDQRDRAEQRRLAKEKQKAEQEAAQLQVEEKLKQRGLATMDKYAERLSFGDAPSMRARLEAADAKFGRINCSLQWQNDQQVNGLSGGADLDLFVLPPRDNEISSVNRESGGGIYDIDRRENDANPVENIFFEEPRPGRYRVTVSCRDGGHVPKNFECSILVSIPGRVLLKGILHGVSLRQVEGKEVLEGATMISGTVYGVGYLHAVTVCEFEVLPPEPEPLDQPEEASNLLDKLTVSEDKKLKPRGRELLSSFRDEDEVKEAMQRLCIQPSATHSIMLGLRSANRKRVLMKGVSRVRMGFDTSKTKTRQAGNPYRLALREMSEQVAAQRQADLLADRRETQIREASSPRVSGLPRRNARTVRDRITNELSMPHPRWSSREGRPRTAVLQRTSISCWDHAWTASDQDNAEATSSNSDCGSSNHEDSGSSILLEHTPLRTSHNHMPNDANVIFERVRRHITKEKLLGRRPRSSPQRRQQYLDQQALLRNRAHHATRAWPVSSLPAIKS